MCPLRVLLLWALLCPGKGNGDQEEIFTRPGSDLLLPIRHHLTLIHTDTSMCDRYEWKYRDPNRISADRIFIHRRCRLDKYENILFPNMRISENGSLIIYNVTLENDGIYSVEIQNSTGQHIQTDDYTVHVEVPVSVPLLHISCLWDDIAEISCRVKAGTKPNISLSVIGGFQEKYSASANNITAIVGSPGPWNIFCSVKNGVSQMEKSRAGVTCPEESRCGMWSGWGHLLSHGVMCVLNTALLIYIVTDLRKMKNERNQSEKRTRRRDQTEMKTEPTYCN